MYKFDKISTKRRSLVLHDGCTDIYYTNIGKLEGIDTFTEVITQVTEGGINVDSSIVSVRDFLLKMKNIMKSNLPEDQNKVILEYIKDFND
jgi:hypothetical protein